MGGNPRYNINNDVNFEKNYKVNFIETKNHCLSLVERDYKLIYDKLQSMTSNVIRVPSHPSGRVMSFR